ncbi:MEIOTIC F-BOX protein MOF-like [Lolium perenne]|uniref:MEIOTIC F-BOX protein MOF-like n=1 Tax=Lolium perenne TaxID=4522 RepID=UPI0021F68220|nr:MEIOTIC F-BOX protein MOF-like isoform X2 [Lolium perenne]XP_051217461.1 MEIOTIC F-BOX protein MOF-like isoform X2 [Lolium perenne]XP_051217462.1 MEIOTIC F-BOX protein MOF-like isoform X2 [Lolium perenne]XP_051217464.1 MEIOTIC F-BOX protein MOF-like isoform X2 [Lolium perenne]
MDASRKKACTGSTSAEDRLSALPDALVHTIMSFLKAHQVVQTSVLAKRWRHLWRSVPNLDIDLPEFNRKIMDWDLVRPGYEKFADFTDYLLFHRHQDGSLLDTFRLHLSCAYQARPGDAGRWVRRGLKCSPRVLHVQYHHSHGAAEVPLELGSGPSSSCRLTKLHLLGLSLDFSFAEQILSVCHVLVELEIRKCSIYFQKITSPSLKNLTMDGSHAGYVGFGDPLNQLIITAPHLVYLHLNLETRDHILVLVNEMSSLVKASMRVQISHPQEVSCQFEILRGLFNVTSLELLGFSMMVPDKKPIKTFKNLTTLLLDECDLGDKFQFLRHLLQNSPNLVRLVVKFCQFAEGSKRWKGKARSKKKSSQRQDVVDFNCSKLRYTDIVYKSGDNVRQLVNILLDISDHLPENVITLTKVDTTVYPSDDSESE